MKEWGNYRSKKKIIMRYSGEKNSCPNNGYLSNYGKPLQKYYWREKWYI